MRARLTRHLATIVRPATATPVALDLVTTEAGLDIHGFGTRAAYRGLASEKPIPLPAEFSWHDYAVFLLHVAAEIEHALMVQYLYGAYSLGGPQVPEQYRAVVRDWQTLILGIAKEEMGHLVTVQNLLR